MTTAPDAAARPAEPMQGPDFDIQRVRAWQEQPGAESELVLADGSHWRVDPGRSDYAVLRAFIVRAVERRGDLLVSGDRASGLVDRVATARALAAQRVGPQQPDGRMAVLFAGPPSIYYLRPDRPHAAQSLELLRRSAAGQRMPHMPDLLVGIDTVSSEVILVKLLDAGR